MKKEVSEKSERFLDIYFKSHEELRNWLAQEEPEQFCVAPNVREKDKATYPLVTSVRRKEETSAA